MSSINNSDFALRRKALLRLIDSLRDIDVRNSLNLPKIVAVGNQSAGKSSLIEAISEIELPRGTGTCTRCAMEIRLHHDTGNWKADVKLHRKFDEGSGAGIVPFSQISDKSQIQTTLRQAQRAILNPSKEPSLFLSDTSTTSNIPDERRFSKNVVLVDLYGPNLTDLTFIDLPGIIAGTRDATHTDDVEIIKDLARSYLQGNSLILLTVSMQDDFENSGALELVRAVSDYTTRTVGVLTKADCVKSFREQWLSILQNKESPLNHGYYVTKHRDTANQTQTYPDEASFFNTTPPWDSIDPDLRERLGTTNLVQNLSMQFTKLIQTQLPEIKTRITTELAKVTEELEPLEARTKLNPLQKMLDLCNEYSKQVDWIVKPEDAHEDMLLAIKHEEHSLGIALAKTIPPLSPHRNSGAHERYFVFPNELMADDPKFGEEMADAMQEAFPPKLIFLESVREMLVRARTRHLPGFLPFSVARTLILSSTNKWPALVESFVASVEPIVRAALQDITDRIFGGHADSRLKVIASNTVEQSVDYLITILRKEKLATIHGLIKLVYTQNTTHYVELRSKLLDWYRKLRMNEIGENFEYSDYKPREVVIEPFNRLRQATVPFPVPSHPLTPTPVSVRSDSPKSSLREVSLSEAEAFVEIQSLLKRFGITCNTKDELIRIHPPDEYDDELQVISSVHAYFKVAMKRAMDEYPRAVDEFLLQPLSRKILDGLQKSFRIYEPDGYAYCEGLLAESQADRMNREQMRERKTMLKKAAGMIDLFERTEELVVDIVSAATTPPGTEPIQTTRTPAIPGLVPPSGVNHVNGV